MLSIFGNFVNIRNLSENQSNSSYSLSYKGLIAVMILIFYTVAAPIFQKLHFHYLHESGICMIIGAIVALISKYVGKSTNGISDFISFDDDLFFNLILPPIIFSAGYNLKKRAFFKYIVYIIIFGVFGTLICFGIVTFFIFYSNKLSFFTPFSLDVKTVLLFSSIIASTDTVAAMTFIKEEEFPKLFSVLFGEGVLNDAVCIVLYRIISSFEFTDSGNKFNFWTLVYIIGRFLMMFLISCLLGIAGGLVCSYLLKILKKFSLNRIQETSLIIFFAFETYSVTELLHYSPIISLLFCGIFMSHYAFYNLSFQAREESSMVSKILSNIAEGFIFAYLGFSSVSTKYESFNFWFILLALIYVSLGRFISVCGLSLLNNFICRSSFSFDKSEQGITFFAGCIRGAIAFGLSTTLPITGGSDKEKANKNMLVCSTLILVFFTTIVFGALMSKVVGFFNRNKKEKKRRNSGNNSQFNEKQFGIEMKKYSFQGYDSESIAFEDENGNVDEKGKRRKIEGIWKKIDNKFFRPLFIDDWQNAVNDHREIAKEIMHIYENHEKNKMKQKILRRLSGNALIPESNNRDSKDTQEIDKDKGSLLNINDETTKSNFTLSKSESLLFKD